MPQFFQGLGLGRKQFPVLLWLFYNALLWLYMLQIILAKMIQNLRPNDVLQVEIWAAFFTITIFSMLLGAAFRRHWNRRAFLISWIIFGGAVTFIPLSGFGSNEWELLWMALIFGTAFGIGVPSVLAQFADSTTLEERGRVAGSILALSYSTLPIAFFLVQSLELTVLIVIFALWRISGSTFYSFGSELPNQKKPTPGPSAVIAKKYLLAYLIPWFLFNLANQLLAVIVGVALSPSVVRQFQAIEFIAAGGSAFAFGFISDYFGRKRTAIYGLAVLGLSHALYSFLPITVSASIVLVLVDGIAWGILLNSFVFSLWADIAPEGLREKYYAIGMMPLFLSGAVLLFITPVFATIPQSQAFSINAFFLFVAIVPLLIAPETLPSEVLENRQLRDYLKRARKIRAEFS